MRIASLVLCTFMVGCGGDVFVGTDSGTDGGKDAAGDGSDGSVQSDGGGGPCSNGACSAGLHCCSDTCVNEMNDPLNCGGCGKQCTGATPMCLGGTCAAATCAPACATSETCCQIDGPGPSGPPVCVPGNTCPVGCPLCN